jgi:hypothetical protein
VTTQEAPLCSAYDQIAGCKCRYYANHGGKHNFARLEHDAALERELRRQLDEVAEGLAEALDLFDANWCPEHGYAPTPEAFAKAARLSKLVGREHAFYVSMVEAATSGRRVR